MLTRLQSEKVLFAYLFKLLIPVDDLTFRYLVLPVVYPTMVAPSVVDGAFRRHGGGGDSGQHRRHMDRSGQQADEECYQLFFG